jgi:hypothetical protein
MPPRHHIIVSTLEGTRNPYCDPSEGVLKMWYRISCTVRGEVTDKEGPGAGWSRRSRKTSRNHLLVVTEARENMFVIVIWFCIFLTSSPTLVPIYVGFLLRQGVRLNDFICRIRSLNGLLFEKQMIFDCFGVRRARIRDGYESWEREYR